MRQHICGQGCNGDIHAELIAEPPSDSLNEPTLRRWLGVKQLYVCSLPSVFFEGVGDRRFAQVLWR